jgi:hypothetical protein
MITGRKPADADYADLPARGGAGPLAALAVFAACALAVTGGVWLTAGALI